MIYTICQHEQGTPEWKADRAGKGTGSKAKCVVAEGRTKGVEAVTRRDYRVQLVAERLSGCANDEEFVTKEMQWGIDHEADARLAYEIETGELVERVGFLYRADMAAGCSLDGFVSERRGIWEAKCPKTATHISYLLAARIPPEYVPQITHNLLMTGADFVDFVSYDPRLPESLQLFHIRAQRSEFDVAGYEAELRKFLKEVDGLEAQLRARTLKVAA